MRTIGSDHVVAALLVLVTVTTLGCGGDAPSRSSIDTAVKAALKTSVPVRLGGAVLGERDIVVEGVNVQAVGSAQGNPPNQYWPVRVHVTGTYVAEWDSMTYRFDEDAEFLLRRNAFDEWMATLASSPQ